jgi:hypothetical protein
MMGGDAKTVLEAREWLSYIAAGTLIARSCFSGAYRQEFLLL